ncbi:MAG: RimK family alpha-L-glutamate ligase [Candidatus Thermoplasmatota archaeon]
MKIGILSMERTLYTTRRLIWAAKDLGHEPICMNTLNCSLMVGNGNFRVFHEEEEVGNLGVVLARIGSSITDYGLAVVRHFEFNGIPVINSPDSIANSRDKFRCLQILLKNGINVPETILTRSASMALHSIKLLGGSPVILKMLQGTHGVGVMLVDTPEAAESVLETFWEVGKDIQIQQFIKESKGRDIRALVIGDRVVAAMQRVSKKFRANIHRDGEGIPIKLTPEQKKIATKSASVLGLKIAGIDMILSNKGTMVLEANSSPGFEGLERATQKDVAKTIISYVVDYAKR